MTTPNQSLHEHGSAGEHAGLALDMDRALVPKHGNLLR